MQNLMSILIGCLLFFPPIKPEKARLGGVEHYRRISSAALPRWLDPSGGLQVGGQDNGSLLWA